jgi:hypothetical protein
MIDQLTRLLLALRYVCGGHLTLTKAAGDSVLGNAIVIALTGMVTLGCIVAACWMVIRPGERNPDHPKYRILRADR